VVLHDGDDWTADTVVDALTSVLGLDVRLAVELALRGAHETTVAVVSCSHTDALRFRSEITSRYPLTVTVEPR